MGFFKKEVKIDYRKELKRYLDELANTEEQIHMFSKQCETANVLELAKRRGRISEELEREFKEIQLILNNKNYVIEKNMKKHHQSISDCIKEIYNILQNQLKELNDDALKDNQLRTIAIHGHLKDKNGNDTDSPHTAQLKKLAQLLDNQSWTALRYTNEIQEELKAELIDNREDSIKKRFLFKQLDGKDYIYDAMTKLYWPKDLTKLGKEKFADIQKHEPRLLDKDNKEHLPSREEFESLKIIDGKNKYPKFEDLVKIGFIIDEDKHYVLTRELYESTSAYVVSFLYGYSGDDGLTSSYYVLCVRNV